MKVFHKISAILLGGIFGVAISFAQVVISIVPLKYELDVDPGDIITKTATVRNTTSRTLIYDLEARSFVPNNVNGAPNWIFSGETVPPPYDQYILTDWISFGTSSVVVPPNSQKIVPFTINVPANAVPGTYYWWVIFRERNYVSWDVTSGAYVGVRGEWAIILIVKVTWDVVISWWVEDIKVYGWLYKPPLEQEEVPVVSGNDEDIVPPLPISGDNNFTQEVNFEIDFKNEGNVHIKPKGKIEIIDENGQRLQDIGKEMIVNKQWVKIWEKIVDYIPINDEGGNVLPQSKRKFQAKWKWFLYRDPLGNIKYRAPGEYYTLQNIGWEYRYLYFWQTIKERQRDRKMHAVVSLVYTWADWKLYTYQTGFDFNVVYTEKYVALNDEVVWVLAVLSLILWYILCRFWILPLFRKRKKKNLEKQSKKKYFKVKR